MNEETLQMFREARQVPKGARNDEMWGIYEDFLDSMVEEKPIFARGLFTVIKTIFDDLK